MHKFNARLVGIGLSALIAAVSGLAQTQSTDPNATPPKSEPAAPKKQPKSSTDTGTTHGMPFRGKLQSVDKVEKTLTIKGKDKDRTFQITSHTKLSKAGKPATLADAVVGDEVSGFAKETVAGKFDVLSIRLGVKPPGQAKAKKPAGDQTKGESKAEQKPQ